MLNKPKFMSPSINMYGNSVIDLTADVIPFSCIVDGNEAVTAFRIEVAKLEDNEIVFDTGVQSLPSPFYPINNRNQNVVFSRNLKDYFDSAVTRGNFENSSKAYYWNITLINTTSGTQGYSSSEVFYANTTPATVVSYSYDTESYSTLLDNTILNKRTVYFKSTYSQAENVPLKRYGWRLTDTTNNHIIMDTISTNQIYGTPDNLSCVCKGLVNHTGYLLELYVETQNGYFDIVQAIPFTVSYTVKNLDADFDIEALRDTPGIFINWGDLRTTEGVVEGSVSYLENYPIDDYTAVSIPKNSKIVFSKTSNKDTLDINEDSYIVLSLQFDKGSDITLFEISGVDDNNNTIKRKLEYTLLNRKLIYTITKGGVVRSCEKELSATVGDLCWYVATLYPLIDNGDDSDPSRFSANFNLVESVASGGLFPSDTLYPSDTVYPNFGTWDKLRGGES